MTKQEAVILEMELLAFFGPNWRTRVQERWYTQPWYRRAYWTLRGKSYRRTLDAIARAQRQVA